MVISLGCILGAALPLKSLHAQASSPKTNYVIKQSGASTGNLLLKLLQGAPSLPASAPTPAPEKTILTEPSPPVSVAPASAPIVWEKAVETESQPQAKPAVNYLNHEVLDRILNKYVSKTGWVDYRSLKKDSDARDTLKAYVQDLSALNPDKLEDSQDRLAAWLNLYNAAVILKIAENYPARNLMQMKDFFGSKLLRIEDRDYSIIALESEVFKEKLHEPRAVFARVNGASAGPKLLREAFHPKDLEKQLEERTWNFLMDRNNVNYELKTKTLILSPIFLWYPEELVNVQSFLGTYLDKIPPYRSIVYTGYDWQINDSKLH